MREPALLWALSFPLLGCVSTRNMLGREVTVREHPYSFRGHALSFFVGSPQHDLSPSLPLVVFLEGDGTLCQDFNEKLWRGFLTRFTGDYLLVRPRTFVNTVCGGLLFRGGEFRRADFMHRIDELETLLGELKRLYPGRPVFLLGHSAGADLAVLFARKHPRDITGLINLGGGLRSLAEVLPEIERVRARRKGLSEDDMARRLEGVQNTLMRIAENPDSERPMWGRTVGFWRQLIFSGVSEAWRVYEGPVLVAQGMKDWRSTPAETVVADSEDLARAGRQNVEFRFYPELGHDLFEVQVFRDLSEWLGRMNAAAAERHAIATPIIYGNTP